MQLVSYRNTEAGARAILNEQDAAREEARKCLQMQRAREIRHMADEWEKAQAEIARRKEIIARQRAEVDVLMEKGRQAAKAFNAIIGDQSFARILERICRATGVSRHSIMSLGRDKRVVLVRHGIMYWACRRSGLSTTQIGQLMGRDHSTMVHGKQAYVKKRAEMGRTLRKV